MHFLKGFMMVYICDDFGVNSTFLSEVNEAGRSYITPSPHKANPKQPTENRVNRNITGEISRI